MESGGNEQNSDVEDEDLQKEVHISTLIHEDSFGKMLTESTLDTKFLHRNFSINNKGNLNS
jgi:hypothetical protein